MKQTKVFQFLDGENSLRIPLRKRIIIGSGDTADIQLKKGSVEPIHCLLESIDGEWKIFNLAPKSVLKVNKKDVVTCQLKENDELIIGNRVFTFTEFKGKKLPSTPSVSEVLKKPLPIFENVKLGQVTNEGFSSAHPLEQMEGAQFSEYIFEDQDEIFPIFKYNLEKTAAEVVILFKEKIISIDYVTLTSGKVYLSGVDRNSRDIVFPYLGKKEKFELLDIRGQEVFLNELPGFTHEKFSDEKNKNQLLGKDDIHMYSVGDIKIYVRGDEAPPMVKNAPFFRRDPELRKYMLLCLLIVLIFFGGINFYTVDKELEKEKAPERIATILYKPKKLRISKQNEVVEEIVKEKPELKKTPVKTEVAVKELSNDNVKSKGDVNSKSMDDQAKKANPVKGPTNNIKKVTTTQKKSGGATKSSNNVVKKVSPVQNKSVGNVDTYKSVDFSSSMSNLMAKGGSLASATNNAGSSVSYEQNNTISSDESAQVEKANVSASVGSLTSQTQGKLESSFGTNGLVQKKQHYIAGVPYREVILGSIDRNDIWRILLENVPQFQYCYQRELDSKSKALEGVLMLQFVIGPSGNVTRASATNKDNNLPPRTKDCVVTHLKTIQFPQPNGGAEVTVNTPLNLQARQR